MERADDGAARARRALAQRLESLQRAGVAVIGKLPPIAPLASGKPALHGPASRSAPPRATVPLAASTFARPAAPMATSAMAASPVAASQSAPSPSAASAAAATPTAPLAPAAKQPLTTHSLSGNPPATTPPASPAIAKTPSGKPVKPAILLPGLVPVLPPITLAPVVSPQDRLPALDVIRTEVAACVRCPELATTRTQTVFGVGSPTARLCFVGEAPGADEDASGEPFVGRAGQLLTKIIEACTLSRDQVYILNVLKCRPPGNRTPAPPEVANCRGYLDRQLEIIRPEYICCLGSVAAKALLNTEVSIGRLRGKFHDYRGIPVMCTYHPAYLLRNPAAKKDVWEDMQTLMARMGIKLG